MTATRHAILKRLTGGEASVGELADPFTRALAEAMRVFMQS